MKFAFMHPIVPFFYFIGLLVFLNICEHPLYRLTIMAAVFVLAAVYAGGKKLFQFLLFFIPFGLLFALINPLLVRRGATILFYLFGSPVTLEAALYGLNQSAMLITVVAVFISFNAIVGPSAFLYILAPIIPRTALLLHMAFYNMARFRQRAVFFMEAQKTRGISAKGGIKTAIKNSLLLLKAFTVRNLEEGMETALVLKARDYGVGKRTHYRAYTLVSRDIFCLILLIILFFIVLTGYFLGAARYSFYPSLSPVALTAVDIPVYAALIIFIVWPLFTNQTHNFTAGER